SSFVIVGRFSVPARSIAFFNAPSHCSGSAFFLVFNAVSDTPNSRCFRHRNHTPSKVPGSISSASDLQIGHVTIAEFPYVVPHMTLRRPTAAYDHQYMPASCTGVTTPGTFASPRRPCAWYHLSLFNSENFCFTVGWE